MTVSRGVFIAREFFASSAHVPLAIALGTLLVYEPASWWPVVPALAGAFIQAWVLGTRAWRGLSPSFAGNMIGVALFAAGSAVGSGLHAFVGPFAMVYAAVSVLVGACQAAAPRLPVRAAEAVVVAEHVVRSLSIAAVYAVVDGGGIGDFLAEPEHRFLAAGCVLLGVMLGMAAIGHRRDQDRLATVAVRLREYGEMLLGRSRLTRAIGREDALEPRRTRRSVLFADVRGFTRWSEPRSPEEVLAMLGTLYEEVESACAPYKPSKTKHTADEVMMFFTEPVAAARAALALRAAAERILSPHGLHIGAGVHHGDVIEGLVGASRTKAYDILGDTVNTAKRICDHAAPGSIMVTFAFFDACRGAISVGSDRSINAKGKSSEVLVCELLAVTAPAEGSPAGA